MDWLAREEQAWADFLRWLDGWKLSAFSGFCLRECPKHCCDLSRIELKASQGDLRVLLGREPGAEEYKAWALGDEGRFAWREGLCPQYDPATRRCRIWAKGRPAICGEFPFGAWHDPLFRDKQLRISPACGFEPDDPLYQELVARCAGFGVSVVKVRAELGA